MTESILIISAVIVMDVMHRVFLLAVIEFNTDGDKSMFFSKFFSPCYTWRQIHVFVLFWRLGGVIEENQAHRPKSMSYSLAFAAHVSISPVDFPKL